MQTLPTWDVKHFFKYNANSGGKTITLQVNGEFYPLTKKRFLQLTCNFSLSGSDRVYKIVNNEVITQK